MIGFFHEHARSDRDNYVTVLENNIRPRDVMNFNKLTHSTNEAPYDLASDMQYGPKVYCLFVIMCLFLVPCYINISFYIFVC